MENQQKKVQPIRNEQKNNHNQELNDEQPNQLTQILHRVTDLSAQLVNNQNIMLQQKNRNIKTTAKINQLNKWDANYIYTGDKNKYDGKRGRTLREILKKWAIHQNLHGIDERHWVSWWATYILKGKAQLIHTRNAQEIGTNFQMLIRKLTVNTRLESNYEKLKKRLGRFSFREGYTLKETMDKFIRFSKELDKERQFALDYIPDLRLTRQYTYRLIL